MFTYAHVCTHIHINIQTDMHICAYTHVCTYIHLCENRNIQIHNNLTDSVQNSTTLLQWIKCIVWIWLTCLILQIFSHFCHFVCNWLPWKLILNQLMSGPEAPHKIQNQTCVQTKECLPKAKQRISRSLEPNWLIGKIWCWHMLLEFVSHCKHCIIIEHR